MAAQASSTLVRPPLEDPKSQIRLLRILYDGLKSFDEPMRCTLSVHNIEDVDGKYIAVSYTWGSPQRTVQIFIDDQVCTIRYNCWYALWQMRLHNTGPLYWVDSICIDQDCHQEKQDQVGQMGSIFAGARLVAACLGPAGEDEIFFDSSMEQRSGRRPPRETVAEALTCFLSRPYFQRLWIVQECFLARKLDAFCGPLRSAWETLGTKIFHPRNRQKVDDTYERPEAEKEIDSSYAEPPDITESRRRDRIERKLALERQLSRESEVLRFFRDCDTRRKAEPRNLAEIVLQYAQRECYDPRDCIYGFLSLATPATRQLITVEYGKPLISVLHDYIRACDQSSTNTHFMVESLRLLVPRFAVQPSSILSIGRPSLQEPFSVMYSERRDRELSRKEWVRITSDDWRTDLGRLLDEPGDTYWQDDASMTVRRS